MKHLSAAAIWSLLPFRSLHAFQQPSSKIKQLTRPCRTAISAKTSKSNDDAIIRNYVETQPAESVVTSTSNPLTKLTAPPEVPGVPRPVWLTILGSVPTALGWYGYYKFSVEEELYQYEMQQEGRVSGCGGYGTLFPFVYGILIGFPLSFLHIPGGETIVQAAGAWILLGQINLYRRVNELCTESDEVKSKLGLEGPPLHEWWAILPPPLDVVVGLRQYYGNRIGPTT
eukprot:scaffold21503_cov56-Cyclotella_meneghiniana.AAC.1